MHLDTQLAVQLLVLAFTAGAAWGAVRQIGGKVDALKERWEDATRARNEQIASMREEMGRLHEADAVHEARIQLHTTKIAVIEARIGSTNAMKAVRKEDS